MTPRFSQNTQLSTLLPYILGSLTLIAPVAPTSLGSAADCSAADLSNTGALEGITTWKSTTLRITPRALTTERGIYGGLLPAPALEIAPDIKRKLPALGDKEDRWIAPIGACFSQDIQKSGPLNQPLTASRGKTKGKSHLPALQVSAFPSDGQRQVRTIRMAPPEIGTPAGDKPAAIIGPVQEAQKPNWPNEYNVSQSTVMPPLGLTTTSSSRNRSFVNLNPLQSSSQQQDSESLRMNLTTEMVLHGGNCASRCP